ncbi:hypothetical protein CI109_104260 [Kwoniella shandongensis]|uniref:LYR motif-containing protein Cup1-like N-terminal domain-containing protein n=1 Tax=Kwoniella shandongensis TaxID=1734106 RepID=A0A5M6C0L2_9TREE|nr:uncharacterized protein CI109_002834 [Kwoniella shandongensis]KAA5528676.1 hypothetical protein CI109_002834 [Kwoniella shandongensis]
MSLLPPLGTIPHPAHLYRSFLQHLRLLPDPHVWSILQPRFRRLLETPGASPSFVQGAIELDSTAIAEEVDGDVPHAESSKAASIRKHRRLKAISEAQEHLNRLRAAVACHPHALTRLLEESYGQRGSVRWELIRAISLPYGSTTRTPLPPPLLPLRPPPPPPSEAQPRARKTLPDCRVRKIALRQTYKSWEDVKPPIVLPSSSASQLHLVNDMDGVVKGTGWERTGVIANLRHFAGLPPDSHSLPGLSDKTTPSSSSLPISSTAALPKHIRLIFPSKLNPTLREEPYPPPRPKATRANPRTWGVPRVLTNRLVRRTYRRLWDNLVWVRPVDVTGSPLGGLGEGEGEQKRVGEERWKRCTYDEMRAWERGESDRDGITPKSGKKGVKPRKERRSAAVPNNVEDHRWSEGTDDERRLLGL